jgi:hypothetical protein
MYKTNHCYQRQQQRAIPNQVINWLIEYGEEQPAPGGTRILYFGKNSIRDMKSDIGAPIVNLCSKYWSVIIIQSNDGDVITTYWKH